MRSASVERLRVVGVKQVTRALRAGKLRRVYLASDAAQRLTKALESEAEALHVSVEWVPTMGEIARRFHVDVPSAAAGEYGNE